MKKLRSLENIHIVLWIVKDTFWLLELKILGVIMAIPTLIIAIYMVFESRKLWRIKLPNIAVLCWLFANITWMYSEFFGYPNKHLAIVFFAIGAITMAYFFIKHKMINNS